MVTRISGTSGVDKVQDSAVFATSTRSVVASGYVALSDVLTFLRLTTANGTDLFDAGTLGAIYEG